MPTEPTSAVRATPRPAQFSLAANYDPELVPALDPELATFGGFQLQGWVEVDLTSLNSLQKKQEVCFLAGEDSPAEGILGWRCPIERRDVSRFSVLAIPVGQKTLECPGRCDRILGIQKDDGAIHVSDLTSPTVKTRQ